MAFKDEPVYKNLKNMIPKDKKKDFLKKKIKPFIRPIFDKNLEPLNRVQKRKIPSFTSPKSLRKEGIEGDFFKKNFTNGRFTPEKDTKIISRMPVIKPGKQYFRGQEVISRMPVKEYKETEERKKQIKDYQKKYNQPSNVIPL